MRRTRVAIAVVFFADGLLIGSWASRIPAVKLHAQLTDTKLGLALFAAALGALVAMPLAGWLSGVVGSRRVTVVALSLGSVALFGATLAGGLAGLAVALFVFGAGFGAINVSANAQGLALERQYGRSILSSFHAAFSGGALAGAALGALAAAAGIGQQAHLGTVAIVVVATVVVFTPRLLPSGADDSGSTLTLVRPPRALLVIGAAAFFTLFAEGTAADWSAVYLSSSLAATAAVAALAYTAFSLAMVASRLAGDRLNSRFGPVTLVRAGGVLAAAGLALALASGSTVAGLVGFGAMGVGLGVVVPVLFRAAGSRRDVAAGIGVAAVSTIGWLGFLAGPPTIGFAAGAVGVRGALWIVVLAAVALALLAPSVGSARRPESSSAHETHAVLADLDGVLVDSGAQIEATWRAFAERQGLDPEVVVTHGQGRRSIDLIRLVAPHLDADAEAARIECEEIERAQEIRPLPGARELVGSLRADRFAIVTSGTRALALARLSSAGIPIPDVLVTAENVDAGKPDPAGYLRAASLLGVEPADSVVLEDAPVGVEAGLAAGMTVIAVLTTTEESALRDAHRRVADLRELLPESDGELRLRGRDSNPNFLVQRKLPAPPPKHRFVA